MKPGNRQEYGANSCRIVIFSPERWGSNVYKCGSFVKKELFYFDITIG